MQFISHWNISYLLGKHMDTSKSVSSVLYSGYQGLITAISGVV